MNLRDLSAARLRMTISMSRELSRGSLLRHSKRDLDGCVESERVKWSIRLE
jgi:hypothetical protein